MNSAETPAAGRNAVGLTAMAVAQAWAAGRAGLPEAKFRNTVSFLDHARALGAAGIQSPLEPANAAAAAAVRERLERTGLWFEGEVRWPLEEADLVRFEAEVRWLRAAGATVVRTTASTGRRFEAMSNGAELEGFLRDTERRLVQVERVMRGAEVRLGLENHQDFRAAELIGLLEPLGSQWVGVCLDVANNFALLEEPEAVVRALAPFAVSVHLKDLAVQETEEGFLMADAPLGRGILDLPSIFAALAQVRSGTRWHLDGAVRDPRPVPCLAPVYWATMGEVRGPQLAAALARVRRHRPRRPLPQVSAWPMEERLVVEERAIRDSLAFLRDRE